METILPCYSVYVCYNLSSVLQKYNNVEVGEEVGE